MTQIAIVLSPGVAARDAIGRYGILRERPDPELRFVARPPGRRKRMGA